MCQRPLRVNDKFLDSLQEKLKKVINNMRAETIAYELDRVQDVYQLASRAFHSIEEPILVYFEKVLLVL